MRTGTMRTRSLSLAAAAAVMAPAAIGLISPAANAATVQPTLRSGNPTCVGLGYDYGFKPGAGSSENVPGEYTDPTTGITVSFTGGTPEVDWQSNRAPAAVIVKGGNAANEYVYGGSATSDSGLVSPVNSSGKPANLSHLEFCFTYNVDVTKTATTSYERTYGWTIAKTANPTELTLSADQAQDVAYSVAATRDQGVDSDWAVAGTVTLANPWPVAADVVALTDTLSDGTAVTLDCGGVTTVPAKGAVQCTYAAPVASAASGVNTAAATVSFAGKVRTAEGTAPYSFGAPTVETDECATITDSLKGDLGQTCESKTFDYTLPAGPYSAPGTYQVVNTATLVTNDSKTTSEATATVDVTVPALSGSCTLTQGYWKTHSKRGPATYDEAWKNIGAAEEATAFFGSGQTWLQVFNTPPRGNAYYILAVQYMAATLNVADGAAATPEVTQALADAKAIFAGANGTALAKDKADAAKKLASLLDDYNNGKVGPGHCTE